MRKKVLNVFRYVFLSIVSFISVFPFFWMIVAATNKSVEVTKGTMIPGTYFFENLKTLLASDLQYVNAFKNSIIIAIVTTALAMVVSSAAGYAFVVYKTKARERVFNFIFLSMMVPFAALMVPLFRLFSKFSNMGPLKVIALNTPMAVIIIAIATAFLIFFFKQNAQTFPKELIEAARIDGAHEFRIFNQIVLPLMKPAIAVQAIFTFVSSWNNYFIPSLIINRDSKKTLPILIAQLRSADFLKFDMGKVYMMLGCAILPVIIVYLCLSKFIVRGVTLGGVKG